MAGAARVLGTDVGSTAPVFLAVLGVHVIAGLAAVAAAAGIPFTMRAIQQAGKRTRRPDGQHARQELS
jgi:hypothetical protein